MGRVYYGRHNGLFAALLLTLPVVNVASLGVQGADETPTVALSQLRAAYTELDQWLGKTEAGKGWRLHLRADELERQMALDRKADRALLRQVLARYATGDSGLEMPRFRAVRGRLEAWLDDLAVPSLGELPTALRAAEQSFRRPTEAQLAESRQLVRQALDKLSQFLAKGPNGPGWKVYLRWADLEANLGSSNSTNLKTLREIGQLFAARHNGLDWPQFAEVRLALEAHIAKASLATEAEGPRAFRQTLEDLARAIERGESATPGGRQHMNEALVWLQRHEQAPELVRAVRQRLPQLTPQPAPAPAVARVTTPVIRLMSAAKDRNLRQLLPAVDDEGLQRVLADPSLILYTEDEMPRTYQIWDGQLQGVHLASYNISADQSERFGNGNYEFPWGAPAGTHRSSNSSSFRFIYLPRDARGRLRPIVWYQKHLAGDANPSYAWIFPVGSVVGEVLTVRGPSGYDYTYEMRLRFRKSDRWGVDVLRPFPTAEDLARRIRELRPHADRRSKVGQLVAHLEQPRALPWRHLADEQPGQRVFAQWAGVDVLPAAGDDKLIAELLTDTTFTSCLDQTWRVGSNGAWTFAPTTRASFHVVPNNYDAGFVEVNGRSCLRCHSTTNQHVDRFNFGRDWYGHIRGSDGIFSFHPFEPGTVSGNGSGGGGGVSMRQELTRAGVLEAYDRSRHSAMIYCAVPGLER
jgi:hypothetical protein